MKGLVVLALIAVGSGLQVLPPRLTTQVRQKVATPQARSVVEKAARRVGPFLLTFVAKPAWAATGERYGFGIGAILRAFGVGALLFLVIQSARMRQRPSTPKSLLDQQFPQGEPPARRQQATAVEEMPPPQPSAVVASAAPAAVEEKKAKPILSPSQQAALKAKPGAGVSLSGSSSSSSSRGLTGLFSRKKTDRAIKLEDVLLAAESETSEAGEFCVAVAGCLLAELPKEFREVVVPADVADTLAAPWLARSDEARKLRAQRAAQAWRTAGKAVSFYDFGVTGASQSPQPAEKWRKMCDTNEVAVSHFDFGVRATESAKATDRRRFDVVKQTLARLAPQPGTDLAEAFANVVNAMLVPLVDAAVATLKQGDDAKSLPPLIAVADFAKRTSELFDELGLPPLPKPVVYEGKATKGQLASLFSRYAAAAVAVGLDDDADDAAEASAKKMAATAATPDVDTVDVLQYIFGISDKRAKKLADQVVGKLVSQMLETSGPGGGATDMASLLASEGGGPGGAAPPSDAEIDAQLENLQVAIESGQLSDADKKEIKKMFKDMLGGRDIQEALEAAESNASQMDPRSRKALELLKKIL